MKMTTLARKSLGKLRHILDRPCSWLDLKEAGVPMRSSMAHRERTVLLELRHYLEGGGLTVYDIGASHGIYATAMAKFGGVDRVYAFEPIPAVYRDLVRRTAGFPQVRCLNLALGDENGTFPFYESAFSYSSSLLPLAALAKAEFPRLAESREITVEVARLDDVVRRESLAPPDFVKIDVQGFEDRVLGGAEETIRLARYCMLEISLSPLYEGAPLFDDIYARMRTLGFTLVALADQVHGETTGRVLQVDGIFRRGMPR